MIMILIGVGCSSCRLGEEIWTEHVWGGDTFMEYEVHFDTEFKEGEIKELREGIGEWNRALNNYVKIIEGGRYNSIELRRERIRPWVGNGERIEVYVVKISSKEVDKIFAGYIFKGVTLAFYDGRGIIYVIWDRLEGENLKYTILHEMGHALGARHIEGGLMDGEYDIEKYKCIDAKTVGQIARKWGRNVEEMNWCEIR